MGMAAFAYPLLAFFYYFIGLLEILIWLLHLFPLRGGFFFLYFECDKRFEKKDDI
jgi:hypothetical protein